MIPKHRWLAVKHRWLIGIVLLCAAGAAVALLIRSACESSGVAEPEPFVSIPSYDYATEQLGGLVTGYKLGTPLADAAGGFSPEAIAATQIVVLKMKSMQDAISVFERISLEYPLEWLSMDGQFGRHARLLGDRHAVFVRGSHVVHVSEPEQAENGGELINEVARRMHSALQSRLKADWLEEVEPTGFSPYNSYETVNNRLGGNMAVFRLRDPVALLPPFGWRRHWEPAQIVVLELKDAQTAQHAAEMMTRLYAVGGTFGEDVGLGERAHFIGEGRVIFTQGNYAADVAVYRQFDAGIEVVLGLARRLKADLEALVAQDEARR